MSNLIQPKCTPHEATSIVDNQTLYNYLKKNAPKKHSKPIYLLAHAHDGIIWGYWSGNDFITTDCEFPQFAKFRECTLQQCRVFCEDSELMLWRTEKGWRARLIENVEGVKPIIEHQMLWGTKVKEQKEKFTLVEEGQDGLEHAVPLSNISDKFEIGKQAKKRPLRLVVHHYFRYNNDGLAYIYLSRLVDLFAN
ncbi:CRISPR-associated protein Csx19 [Scytonema sp. NUACC21]